jgi:hypothetical protein
MSDLTAQRRALEASAAEADQKVTQLSTEVAQLEGRHKHLAAALAQVRALGLGLGLGLEGGSWT